MSAPSGNLKPSTPPLSRGVCSHARCENAESVEMPMISAPTPSKLRRTSLFTFAALRTEAYQSQMNGLSFEFRCPRRGTSQRHRARQIEVNQLAARGTDRVIVPIRLTIVTAGAIAKCDLAHQ